MFTAAGTHTRNVIQVSWVRGEGQVVSGELACLGGGGSTGGLPSQPMGFLSLGTELQVSIHSVRLGRG